MSCKPNQNWKSTSTTFLFVDSKPKSQPRPNCNSKRLVCRCFTFITVHLCLLDYHIQQIEKTFLPLYGESIFISKHNRRLFIPACKWVNPQGYGPILTYHEIPTLCPNISTSTHYLSSTLWPWLYEVFPYVDDIYIIHMLAYYYTNGIVICKIVIVVSKK